MSNKGRIPSWLLLGQVGTLPCACGHGHRKTGFVEKSVQEVSRVLREEYFAQNLAATPGFLQGLDPRAKLITLLGLIGVAGVLRHVETLVIMYAGLLCLASLSKLPWRFFVKRVWLVVPLFTGLMVLPALFNIVSPGDPLWTLVRFGHPFRLGPWEIPGYLSITRQGLDGAVLLIVRVGVSVSLGLLLTATTRWPDLLRALRIFQVPRIFVMILEMTHRYIYLLLQVMGEVLLARKSRTIGPANLKEQRGFLAGTIVVLLGKSQVVSEEVYLAMIARGYRGEPRTANNFRWCLIDSFWLLAAIVSAIILWKGDVFLGA